MPTAQQHRWIFQHLGGLDQVTLHRAEDICRIGELDPKLWVALSCPAHGLEYDKRAMALIDSDKDGRIRIPEVVEAVNWLCARLKDPACIVEPQEALPLDVIDGSTPEGERLLKTAAVILKNLGKEDAQSISQEDAAQAVAHASENLFNGDGVLPPSQALADALNDNAIRLYIQDAMNCLGGVLDAGGEAGINKEISTAFIQTLTAWRAWRDDMSHASGPLGTSTPQAWDLFKKVEAKIDDYFLRCELAAYAPQSAAGLNVAEDFTMPTEGGLLNSASLAELPLSQAAPDKALHLTNGLNPAWRADVEQLFSLCAPLLTQKDTLSRADWLAVKESFAPYAAALAQKPVVPGLSVDVAPTASPDSLSDERIAEILDSDLAARFEQLAEDDSSMPAALADITELERLVVYYRHFYRLLVNFISFTDFYQQRRLATFQSGTLYLDGRSCTLCLPVDDVAKHNVLAAHSQLYLVYCECRRILKKGEAAKDPAVMTIVAAVTAGDSGFIIENRHGVFVDKNGDDWDATVVKIITNPISLREAFFSPYRRMGRMISDQVNKFASSSDESLMASAGDKIQAAAAAPAEAAPAKFDIGKSVGIFAAIGLALGALGTALATIARSLLSLEWWQLPLVFVAIFLIISGPSVIIAWLKLRKRTLGPLLDASGWAINGRAKINFSLGRALTATAALPPHSRRTFTDPYGKRRRWPWVVFICAVLIGAAATFGWFWYKDHAPAQKPAASSQTTQAAAPAAPAPAPQPETPAEPAADAPAE